MLFSCEFCKIFTKTFFINYPQVTASVQSVLSILRLTNLATEYEKSCEFMFEICVMSKYKPRVMSKENLDACYTKSMSYELKI